VFQEDAGPMSDLTYISSSSQNFVALPVGTLIGRYAVTGILGQGTFGITYRAHDSQLGRDVAIKEYLPTSFAIRHRGLTVLPSSTESAEDFAWGRQRFVDEGRTLAGFQRAPGIVRVHDFLEANGTAYIVMELVHGETLGARLQRQGRLSAAEVERILQALLDGLAKVHAASFIHRDIKPDNILLDDEGQPTLIDFGAARAAVAGRTSALTGIFTPSYAAVEQFTDGRQGPFTDIYGLSATLYESIAGEKPPSAIDRMLEDKCVPLATRRPAGFAPALLAGIDRGMAVRPEARPQTIAEWRALLVPAPARQTPVAAPSPIPAPTSSMPAKPMRWRGAAIAGVAVVLVAVAGGALFLFAPQKAPVVEAQRQQAERASTPVLIPDKRQTEEDAQRQAAAVAEKQRTEEETRRQAAAAAEKLRNEEEARRQSAATAAAAAERQRAEEEARRRAAATAAAAERRQVEEEAQRRAAVEQARRQQAETEARQRAEVAARQQAAAEEAQRKADEEARAAVAATEKERRRAIEADQPEAVRQAAEQEAREQEAREKAAAEEQASKAEADAGKARAEAVALERRTAEAAEAALHLGQVDRQKIQVALTAQGFDTHGTDGVLGPRSREMVAAWQAARGLPPTGFLDTAQRQRLFGGAAAAIAKFDADQKKAAEDEARRNKGLDPAATILGASRRPPEAATSAFAGRWAIVRAKCIPVTPQRFFGVTVEGNRFTYGFNFQNRGASCTVEIRPNGSFANNSCEAPLTGQISGNRMTMSQRHPETFCDFEFQKQ
jgi:hypothetical protein